MKCAKCGAELDKDAKFCSQCGGQVEKKHRNRTIRKLQPPRRVDDTEVSDSTVQLEDIQDILEAEASENKSADLKDESDELYKFDPSDDEERSKERHQRRGVTGLIVFIGVAFLAVVVFASLILYRWYISSRIDDFTSTLQTYEQAVTVYQMNSGSYQRLLEEAYEAAKQEDIGAFSDLIQRMEAAINEIEHLAQSEQNLLDLKEIYDNIFSKLQISENYRSVYDDVMLRLDEAIADNDEFAVSQLQQDLSALRSNLVIENKNLVQALVNEINVIDVANANESEKQTLAEYSQQVDALIAEEDYVGALNILGYWKEMAELTQERIRESESEERARWESESLAREKEDDAFRAAAMKDDDNFILPRSDSRIVPDEEIEVLSAEEKLLARNEIYARHGRKFDNKEIQTYFDRQPWYLGTIEPEDFDESDLNDYERKNLSAIRALE